MSKLSDKLSAEEDRAQAIAPIVREILEEMDARIAALEPIPAPAPEVVPAPEVAPAVEG